jgi:hypothetical protein
MRTLSKIALIITAGLLVSIAVGLPFLHQHSNSAKEPTECPANIVQKHLNAGQIAVVISLDLPVIKPVDLLSILEAPSFSVFDGYLFINKAPPAA